MLEGLEATEKRLSELERTWRIDAEFFQRRHIRLAERLAKLRCDSVARAAEVSDGNHFSISESFVEDGIPYYRGQDGVGHFFIEQSTPNTITREAYEQPFMKRSHLHQGDVLLTIIGTVGETSLVKTPREATCSCKLAILRPGGIEPAYLAAYLSSAVGRLLSGRWKRGAVQTGLLLEDMDQIPVTRFSTAFESAVVHAIDNAYAALEACHRQVDEAEQTLVRILGLEEWAPPEDLSYVRHCSEAFSAGRIDAEYLHPQFQVLFADISRNFPLKRLSSLGRVTKGVSVEYHPSGSIPIIRSGDLGNIDNDESFLRSQPTEPIFRLRKGDILISSIGFGSIGKVQVFDKDGVFGTVSEVTVIRQEKLNPYYVAAFLRSRAGQMQIEQHITGATGQLHLYPRDVANFWVPVLNEDTQRYFESQAMMSKKQKQRANHLINAARHSIEIAIEKSEADALTWLQAAIQQPID